ncbi:hypothetical protein DXG01_000073 [Tephrocybe rancida]|nr:hypothetical protein DXG01_000073 [Tephrocybe rancida]
MPRLAPFLSVALLVASLPGALAGPACSRKHYKSSDCVSKCKHGWGWSGRTMGNDRWGGVMRKPANNETLDDALSRACGFEPTATPSASQPLGNVQTGSVTFSSIPTTSSAVVVVPTSSTFNLTSPANNSVSASFVPKTSSSVILTATKPFTTSTAVPAPPKTSSTRAAPATTSVVPHFTTTFATQAKPTTTKATVPTTSVSSGGSSSGSTASSDVQSYLSSHNTIRAQHGAAALTWSDDLASKAQTWANKCVFQHSGGTLGRLGENLAAGTGSSYGIQSAIKSWTDEVSEYNSANPVPSHFTQVVWKGTTQVGCAVQSCDGIFDASFGKAKFYVCEYSPAGNVIGEFANEIDGGRAAKFRCVITLFKQLAELVYIKLIEYEVMLSSRLIFLRTVSEAGYALLVLTTIVATGLSCTALLAQAVRSSPKQTWKNNIDAFIIGASYAIVLVASLLYCGKRRIAMRMRLQRISTSNNPRDDMPDAVDKYVAQEFVRSCLVSYESLPRDAYHEGWGRPGTKYSGIRFRRALLDTIPELDELAHIVIPTHPTGKPRARMLHHFRFILPLLPLDEDGLTPLHYFDASVQLARNGGSGALGEQEFEIGIGAAEEILRCLNECRLEMMESSSTQLSLSSENPINMK